MPPIFGHNLADVNAMFRKTILFKKQTEAIVLYYLMTKLAFPLPHQQHIFCAFGIVMVFYSNAPKYPLIRNYNKTFGS